MLRKIALTLNYMIFDPLDPASLEMTFLTARVNTILWLRKVLVSAELVIKRCYIPLFKFLDNLWSDLAEWLNFSKDWKMRYAAPSTTHVYNKGHLKWVCWPRNSPPPFKKKTEADQFMNWQPSSKSQVTKGCTYFSPIGISVQQIAQWNVVEKGIIWFIGWSLCLWLIVNLVKLKR